MRRSRGVRLRRRTNTPKQEALRDLSDRASLLVEILSTGLAKQLERGFWDYKEYNRFVDLADEHLGPAVIKMDAAQKDYDDSFKRVTKTKKEKG